ncbi:GIN domain-containing protein [Maribacter antarcticus]|uniref:GIN domain-containing protein n=1 Tax=Maribacter antarcticus TaxID=505250 RepID=UPI000563FE96|nr:DUF2807 domain-containing protein [Maribacter antarcticus]
MDIKRILSVVFVFCICLQTFAQRKPKIKGNRNVVVSTEDLARFTEIKLDDDLDISIQKGSVERVTVEADDNLIDVLKFIVSDGTLYISSFYNITSKKKLNITVFYTELTGLTLSNGLITMNDVITADYLDVKASGAARLILNASADVINVQMKENSSGDFNVASDSLNLTFKDRIDAKVYATGQNNTLFMYENASVKMEGKTALFTAKLYGNSALKAVEFKAETMLLNIEDSPEASIYVIDKFELSSKGTAKTSLYGNPKITITEFLDTSQLHKENNQ